ncbi:MAG TPA: PP2C family protein-serine/threonine phosphatase [Ignavibacteria bacterium]|nr:PP2C family protein-serine/threonine phosphatase [Ignavibacteria bacterium]
MEQRKLSRTIEKFITEAPNFKRIEDLLKYVLNQIISYEHIGITGGRIWKLSSNKASYTLLEQMGDVPKIDRKYELKISEFPVLDEISRRRTVTANESNKYLRKKGINAFSATGLGDKFKVKYNGKTIFLYQYLLAFNVEKIYDEFLYALNIIGVTLNSIIRAKKIEKKANENIFELEKASEIQRSILPEHSYKFGNYEIFGISIPDKIVGGDFFDYISIAEGNKLCIVIGDAASKGISAAAQALYVSGALKMGVSYDVGFTTLIKKISNLVNDTFPDERFVTLFLCELYKDRKGLCVYVNAGHNSPFILKESDGQILSLHSTGPVLGPSPNQDYYLDSQYIEKGDFLVLYTDGIVEATNEKFEFYGEDRLKKIIQKHRNSTPDFMCKKIIEDVQRYSSNGKYSDDRTMVVIKRIS